MKSCFFLLFFLECTQSVCTPAAGEIFPDLFKDFQRSILWVINVPDRTVLSLEFPKGLAEFYGDPNCPNNLMVSVETTKSDGTVASQHYCESGTASQMDLFGPTTVNVRVPKETEVEERQFSVKAAPRGQSLVVFTQTKKTFLLYVHIMSPR